MRTVNHKNLNIVYYKKYYYDINELYMNETSIFNFLYLHSNENNGNFIKFDTKKVRFILSTLHEEFNENDLANQDHWIYDNCRKDIDDINFNTSLYNQAINFTNAVCLRYYYSSSLKKYYSKDDREFLWPKLLQGMAITNNIYFNSLLIKCQNGSILNNILGECDSNESIDEYLKQFIDIYYYLNNIQIDPTNYSSPIDQYFQLVSSDKGNNNTYLENYIYLTPMRLITNEGIITKKIIEKNFFGFYLDSKKTEKIKNNNVITKYTFLLENTENIYNRTYSNLLEIIPKLGGTIQFLYYIFFLINFLYSKYTLVMNINSLLFDVAGKFDKKEQQKQMNILFKEKYDKIMEKKGSLVYPKNINSISKEIDFHKILNKNELYKKSTFNPSSLKAMHHKESSVNMNKNKKIKNNNNNNNTIMSSPFKPNEKEDQLKYKKMDSHKNAGNIFPNLLMPKNRNDIQKFKDIGEKEINDMMKQLSLDICSLNESIDQNVKEVKNSESLVKPNEEDDSKQVIFKNSNKDINYLNERNIKNEEKIYNYKNYDSLVISKKNVLKNKIHTKEINNPGIRRYSKMKSNINNNINKKISIINPTSFKNDKQNMIRKNVLKEKSYKLSQRNNKINQQIYKLENNLNINSVKRHNKSLLKGNLSFFSFLKTCLIKNKNSIYLLENFRKKVLSEEHLYKTQFTMFLTQKYLKTEDKININLFDLYKNL